MPQSVAEEIRSDGVEPELLASPIAGLEMAHVFVLSCRELGVLLKGLRRMLEPTGTIWVSWPKKASGIATDVTEDAVRAEALPLGLVDVKVCAVDAMWSGLKLMIRETERGKAQS